jgi:hypothetical protein
LCENRNYLDHKEGRVYYEKHHIIPKCMGGTNVKSNIVLLLAKEHYIAHLLLTRCVDKKYLSKVYNAYIKMAYSKSTTQKRYTSKSFALARAACSEKNKLLFKGMKKSEEWKSKIRDAHIGKNMSDEYKAYCIERNRKMWQSGVFDNRPKHTEETKDKIKQKRKTQVISEESKTKRSISMQGHPVSQETKRKISKARNANPRIWVKNPETREYSSVPISLSHYYLNDGWVKGKYQKDATYVTLPTIWPDRFQR